MSWFFFSFPAGEHGDPRTADTTQGKGRRPTGLRQPRGLCAGDEHGQNRKQGVRVYRSESSDASPHTFSHRQETIKHLLLTQTYVPL